MGQDEVAKALGSENIGLSDALKGKKVAIAHYWLVNMRGGEKVLESLCDLFPGADIYTHVYDEKSISSKIKSHSIFTTFISRLPFAKRLYKFYLPLMPFAFERIDLTGYDLVISSESGPAKSVIPSPTAVHICYCHSPMRYIWDLHYQYRGELNFFAAGFLSIVSHFLRIQDVSSSSRVDHFVANSKFVAKRINKYYRRDSSVIHPPVDVESFSTSSFAREQGKYYLVAGELVGYKKVDLAVEAFNKLGERLVVIGGGSELDRLKQLASDNVELKGKVSQSDFISYVQGCRALIFPGEEDFGIVPIEAMASGKPVLAYKSGGALDYVIPNKTGNFFKEQSVESLISCVEHFEQEEAHYSTSEIKEFAQSFTQSVFKEKFKSLVSQAIQDEACL